jgi:hypothetical protein
LHRERPSDRYSAQKRDELSSLHPTHELGLRAIGKAYHFDRRRSNGLRKGQAEIRDASTAGAMASGPDVGLAANSRRRPVRLEIRS